ncbi:MAG: LuxR C-terminal-related transcriptional regulator [Acidobacteriaceae bacterium]
MSALGSDSVPIKILVVDADQMTAQLLAADLRRRVEFEVIQCAPDAESISDCVSRDKPDVLLLGAKSREFTFIGLPMLRRIRNDHPAVRSIVLLEDSSHNLIAELFRAGVKGVFNRAEYDLQRLCRCIFCVSTGQIWANSEQLGFVLDAFAETASLKIYSANGEELLTRREKDVVRLVAEGLGNREIAQQLGLSSHTVKNYLFNVFDKLGISSRAELVMYVLSNSDNSVSASDGEAPRGLTKKQLQVVRSQREPQFPAAEVEKRLAAG